MKVHKERVLIILSESIDLSSINQINKMAQVDAVHIFADSAEHISLKKKNG